MAAHAHETNSTVVGAEDIFQQVLDIGAGEIMLDIRITTPISRIDPIIIQQCPCTIYEDKHLVGSRKEKKIEKHFHTCEHGQL